MFRNFFKKKVQTEENINQVEKFSADVIPEEDSYITVLLRSGEIIEGMNYSDGMIFDNSIPYTTRTFLFQEEYVKEWYYTKML